MLIISSSIAGVHYLLEFSTVRTVFRSPNALIKTRFLYMSFTKKLSEREVNE